MFSFFFFINYFLTNKNIIIIKAYEYLINYQLHKIKTDESNF